MLIGIGVAMASNGGDDKHQANGDDSPGASAGTGGQQQGDKPGGKGDGAKKTYASAKKDAVACGSTVERSRRATSRTRSRRAARTSAG